MGDLLVVDFNKARQNRETSKVEKKVEKKREEEIKELLNLGFRTLYNIEGFYNEVSTLTLNDDPNVIKIRFEQIIKGILDDVIFYSNSEELKEYLKKFKTNYMYILVALEKNPIFPEKLDTLRKRAIVALSKIK